MAEHPLDRVRRAVEACQGDQLISAEAVIERTRSFAAIESQVRREVSGPPGGPSVHVPLPDLSRFNQLLNDPETRDRGPDKAFTVRADTTSLGCQGGGVFAS
jgi:hypothetical protein